MSFETLGKIRPQIEYKFWASPGQDQTLSELSRKMVEIGNTVLDVDVEGNRLLLQRYTQDQDVWGCRICYANLELVIVDSEEELLAHCDADHEGWRNL